MHFVNNGFFRSKFVPKTYFKGKKEMEPNGYKKLNAKDLVHIDSGLRELKY